MNEILLRIINIISSPIHDKAMLWEVVPILLTIFVVELYFGKYKTEEIGWDTALSNSLALIYVGTNLLHYLYLTNQLSISSSHTIVAICIIFFGLLTGFIDFNHLIPKPITNIVNAVFTINFISFLAIVFVHGHLPIDLITLYASFTMFVVFIIIIKIIQAFEKESY